MTIRGMLQLCSQQLPHRRCCQKCRIKFEITYLQYCNTKFNNKYSMLHVVSPSRHCCSQRHLVVSMTIRGMHQLCSQQLSHCRYCQKCQIKFEIMYLQYCNTKFNNKYSMLHVVSPSRHSHQHINTRDLLCGRMAHLRP